LPERMTGSADEGLCEAKTKNSSGGVAIVERMTGSADEGLCEAKTKISNGGVAIAERMTGRRNALFI